MPRTPTDGEFAEFVEVAWPGLYRTAYLILGEHQLAEDLVQTTLTKTYASWAKVREPAAALGYARVVLAHTAASWFRRRSWRNEQPTASLPDVSHTGPDPTDRPALLDALKRLPPRQRAVVVLRFYDDLSVREVADLLGRSVAATESLLARGRRTLARLVEEARHG